MPMSVILPMIGILSITSEYSQRTGLTTYTLVPWRGRVVLSKLLVVLGIGVASMVVALGVGAVGTLVGSAITGLDPVWNITVEQFALIVLANLIGMLMGFMLGTVIRSSPAAIVAYFVYALVLPGALGALAAFQQWFEDLQPWVDVNYATIPLFDGNVTGENWLQLAITTTVWLWIPLAFGLRAVLRAEVK
jgi:ABC-2 type transport system permease protein